MLANFTLFLVRNVAGNAHFNHALPEKYFLSLVDASALKNQRKKWVAYFADVSAILFFVALDSYDVRLRSSDMFSQMVESLHLFSEASSYFASNKIPTLLIFNRKDLFKEKICKVPLSECFIEYHGNI